MFLSTTNQKLQLSSGRLVTVPLAVYRIPCNDTISVTATGLGTCPSRITVTIPMASPIYVLGPCDSQWFDHDHHLNKSVIRDLDTTFRTIDGELSDAIHDTNQDIGEMQESSFPTIAVSIAYTAFGLGIVNLIICFVFFYCTHSRHGIQRFPHCHQPRRAVPNSMHSLRKSSTARHLAPISKYYTKHRHYPSLFCSGCL